MHFSSYLEAIVCTGCAISSPPTLLLCCPLSIALSVNGGFSFSTSSISNIQLFASLCRRFSPIFNLANTTPHRSRGDAARHGSGGKRARRVTLPDSANSSSRKAASYTPNVETFALSLVYTRTLNRDARLPFEAESSLSLSLSLRAFALFTLMRYL